MGQDTGQLDISDRQLMDSNSQAKASEWTEIGQAEIVHTIFGKAKVRIIRKQDKMRSAAYLLAMGISLAIAWKGWVLYERTEPKKIESLLPKLTTRSELSTADSQQQATELSTISLSAKSNTKPEISNPVSGNQSKLQQTHDLSNGQINSKSIVHRPVKSVLPQSGPIATDGNELQNQSEKTLFPQQASKQPLNLSQRLIQSPASSPAATSLIVSPGKESASPQSTGDIQFSDPINAKH